MLLKRKLSSGLTNNGGGFLLNLFLKQHNAVARLHAPIYNTGDLVLNSSSSIVRSDLCSPAYSVIEKKKKKKCSTFLLKLLSLHWFHLPCLLKKKKSFL